MKSDKNRAMPINTWFGGVCCSPNAFFKNDRTIIILVKQVVIIRIDGASASTVSISIISSVSTPLPLTSTFTDAAEAPNGSKNTKTKEITMTTKIFLLTFLFLFILGIVSLIGVSVILVTHLHIPSAFYC